MSTICLIAAPCISIEMSSLPNIQRYHLLSIYFLPWASLFLIMSRYPWSLVSDAWSAGAAVSAPGPGLPLSIVWHLIIAQMLKDH